MVDGANQSEFALAPAATKSWHEERSALKPRLPVSLQHKKSHKHLFYNEKSTTEVSIVSLRQYSFCLYLSNELASKHTSRTGRQLHSRK